MTSAFNPEQQNSETSSKIVVALERLSEVFRVLLWKECKQHSLSPIQTQILIHLLFQPVKRCSVGHLASEFNMSRATISDSVRCLLEKGLLYRACNTSDLRSITLGLTTTGRTTAEEAANFSSMLEDPIRDIKGEDQGVLLHHLLRIIGELNKSGVITPQRMCLNCANHRYDGKHYCQLLNSQLAESELRVDCKEHELV